MSLLILYTLSLQQNEIREVQATPQERVAAVRPVWETLPHDERVQLLTVDLGALRAKARLVHESSKQQTGERLSHHQCLAILGLFPLSWVPLMLAATEPVFLHTHPCSVQWMA